MLCTLHVPSPTANRTDKAQQVTGLPPPQTPAPHAVRAAVACAAAATPQTAHILWHARQPAEQCSGATVSRRCCTRCACSPQQPCRWPNARGSGMHACRVTGLAERCSKPCACSLQCQPCTSSPAWAACIRFPLQLLACSGPSSALQTVVSSLVRPTTWTLHFKSPQQSAQGMSWAAASPCKQRQLGCQDIGLKALP